MPEPAKIFQRGLCVNCDSPITTGILCPSCTPEDPEECKALMLVNKPITEMELGEEGFVESYAIFEAEGKLYIIGTATISVQPEQYKTVKIKCGHSAYFVYGSTIDREEILDGWPDLDGLPENIEYLPAKLVRI